MFSQSLIPILQLLRIHFLFIWLAYLPNATHLSPVHGFLVVKIRINSSIVGVRRAPLFQSWWVIFIDLHKTIVFSI